MSKNGNKGSYVVMLEQAKQPPKLITKVVPIKGTEYKISIIHPNTRKVLLEKTEQCKDLNEAFDKANALKESDEVKLSPDYQDPWYEEVLFIPNPKRGSMKLKTKESVEDELNDQLDAIVDDDEAYDFSSAYNDDEEDDVPVKKGSKAPKKAGKVKEKAAKAPKKAKPVKSGKKINKPAKLDKKHTKTNIKKAKTTPVKKKINKKKK